MLYRPEYSLAFRTWLETPLGRKFSFIEGELITSILPELFGYNAVILGDLNYATSLQPGNFKVTSLVNGHLDKAWSELPVPAICARQDKLPIESEAIDFVYLAHCLEFTNNPHEILREAHRILRADGHIVITVFNSISLWGIWRYIARIGKPAPWRANFMSLIKLKDWLALLGFDIIRVNHFGFCLPLQIGCPATKLTFLEKYSQKLRLPFGAAFSIEAAKRIIPVTPIKPVWLATRDVAVHDDATAPTV